VLWSSRLLGLRIKPVDVPQHVRDGVWLVVPVDPDDVAESGRAVQERGAPRPAELVGLGESLDAQLAPATARYGVDRHDRDPACRVGQRGQPSAPATVGHSPRTAAAARTAAKADAAATALVDAANRVSTQADQLDSKCTS